MPFMIGLDFETFGAVDLRKHGLDRYVSDSSFRPLIAAVSPESRDGGEDRVFDFVRDESAESDFKDYYYSKYEDGYWFVAHNAGFERAVLSNMGVPHKALNHIVDSAVIARCLGASSHLEAAAPQLLNVDKLESGKNLIQKFSIPNEWNEGRAPWLELLLADTATLADWAEFARYCLVDARLSVRIASEQAYPWMNSYTTQELKNEWLTFEQNALGWKVDLDLVLEMKARYEQNVEVELARFRAALDPKGELNFSSPLQLKEWCAERGVVAKSFDSQNVDALLQKVSDRVEQMHDQDVRYEGYVQVRDMLRTKKVLGGSSLKKLQTILDTVGEDGRLRNQYMFCGAGQSYRTSGRGVQMQNLKRLGSEVLDVDRVFDPSEDFDNDTLGENLRQVFTASHPQGELIVGDFSSVESRGLAYLAGAEWKLDAYRSGKDMYKVQAAEIYQVAYEDVDKEMRKTGKLGELSCGYGAGPVAVSVFAKGMGIDMTEDAALQLVRDWRSSNPEVVDLWDTIDSALHRALDGKTRVRTQLGNGLSLEFSPAPTPESLQHQHPGAMTMSMNLWRGNVLVLERTFQGCYKRGRNVCYYKPSDRKTGALWSSHFVDPKTKKVRFYEVYGGKLAGILTQSMCRELFFFGMECTDYALRDSNARLVGQFHDELVVDWVPGLLSLSAALGQIQRAMTTLPGWAVGFPLEADIKHSYRYTK